MDDAEKNADELIIGCMISGNIFSEECALLREKIR
jgi:hypothetical protein